MSERWVEQCERILEQIKITEAGKDRDRLELVHSMRFGLIALWNSLSGWMRWINNPDVMAKFDQEELNEMNKTITDFVKSFIEYDIKITKQGIQKDAKEIAEDRASRTRNVPGRFYV